MNELIFRSNGGGTCVLFVCDNFSEEILRVPEKSPDGEKITLVCTRSAHVKKIFLPATVNCIANSKWVVAAIVFAEGLNYLLKDALFNVHDVTFPASLTYIDEEAFMFDEDSCDVPTIRAPKNSVAHRFAVKKNFQYVPTDCPPIWDADAWLKKFRTDDADYRTLRRDVWKNTRAIVEDNSYSLPSGNSVLLTDAKRYSQFYYKPFNVSFKRLSTPPEITVTADDCLDAAHKWVNDGLEVCVLNMANRRNPGGGVTTGAGAQEEYLFRCSDYYKFLYRYAPYAEQYGVTRSHYQYPLDRDFGGIFSGGVTIFRENEATGYHLTDKPWKVNMIAVAGMNSPRLVIEDGEERIAPELVEGVKNKLRTILRIACDRGQKNLVLGAIGCGAFHNPPKHVAELFREILCEHEFYGAFKKICFAVKTSHTSKGDTNFAAFKSILDGFLPTLKADSSKFENPIKKIVAGRDFYALLKMNGEVQIFEGNTSRYSRRFRKSIDIAAGSNHIIGLREDSKVVLKLLSKTDSDFRYVKEWYGGIAVAACEGHSAMLKTDGTVLCADHGFDRSKILSKLSRGNEELIAHQLLSGMFKDTVPRYRKIVESWQNIKQIALTYEAPFALTRDGKFFCMRKDINEFFNACGKEIIQISAFGAYYTNHVVAALYFNGTVKACDVFYDSYEALDEIESWHNVKKICCGHHMLIGLTNEGKILISSNFKHDDIETLENIIDIAEGSGFIALSSTGEII